MNTDWRHDWLIPLFDATNAHKHDTRRPNAAGEKDAQPECDQMTELRCRSGECVPLESRCDGVLQCNDGSDEDNCPTESSNGTRDGKCAGLRTA